MPGLSYAGGPLTIVLRSRPFPFPLSFNVLDLMNKHKRIVAEKSKKGKGTESEKGSPQSRRGMMTRNSV